ncbi:hypothetical protein ACH4UY_25630 [Streptomyces longwoodensis]|uniref:hypothetical protein n=1 Tax=Streptomyces longwoodensis TaxID=68231 RepID=UPI0037B59B9A
MVRTAHVLSVAALTGAVLVTGPAARADPAAEVGPASVDAGGTVTVSVTCDPLGAPAPETLDATSDAFADGTAHLRKVTGSGDELSGPAYRGTARVAAPAGDLDEPGDDAGDADDPGGAAADDPAEDPDADAGDGADADDAWTVDGTCPAPPGGQPSPWSAPLHVTRSGTGATTPCAHPGGGTGQSCGGGTPTTRPVPPAPHPVPTPCDRPADPLKPGTAKEPGASAKGPGAAAEEPGDSAQDPAEPFDPLHPAKPPEPVAPVEPPEPPEPVKPGHQAEPVTPVDPDAPGTRWDGPCGDAPVQHGVRAGQGGTFTDSVPALAAGGLLIAGALGAAAHRLRRRGGTGRT